MTFPTRLESITASWLSEVFDADVKFEIESIGDGPGFMSDMCFLRLESESDSVPARVVAKVNPVFEASNEVAEKYRIFEREASFYRDAAPRTPIRTPGVYFADTRANRGIMLLEDCSRFESRLLSNKVPLTVEEACSVAASAARLHARWWSEPTDTFLWAFTPGKEQWQSFFGDCAAGWQNVSQSEVSQLLSDESRDLVSRLEQEYASKILRAFPSDRLTLCHLDFHVDNMFFDPGADDPIVLFDWSGANWGRGVFDLCYFLGFVYEPSYRASIEQEVLDHYFNTLVENGVTDYSHEEMTQDYAYGLVFALWVIPLAVTSLDLSTDYGQLLIEKLVKGKLQAALDHGAMEILDRL
jgi:thiamine kinase-like enzyme